MSEPDKTEDWDKLLAWLSLSRFNTGNYRQLEDYLQGGGNEAMAAKVFISRKKREAKIWLQNLKAQSWWHPVGWMGWLTFWLYRLVWGGLAGYGRKPGRTLWISLFLIILGAFILNPADVLPRAD